MLTALQLESLSNAIMLQILVLQPQSSPLFRLPIEILIQIFKNTDNTDQLCLALTCKFLLQIAESLHLEVHSAREHELVTCCTTMEDILRRIKPLNRRGQPSRAWHVCLDCVRYRPTRKSYWKKRRLEGVGDAVWKNCIDCWNNKYSLQCPDCWARR